MAYNTTTIYVNIYNDMINGIQHNDNLSNTRHQGAGGVEEGRPG